MGDSGDITAAPVPTPRFGLVRLRAFCTGFSAALGATLLLFDLGWVPGLAVRAGEVARLGVLAAAVYLFALSVAGWVFFGRTAARRVVNVGLGPSGLTARLATGALLRAEWDDPTLALTLRDWSPGSSQPVALQWGPTAKGPYAFVTRDGARRVESDARSLGLRVESRSSGEAPRIWRETTIRPP